MAVGRTQQGAKAGRAPADARVAAMLARHGGALMRVARQWSLCHDDALDAFQRGLEIYVRRMESVEPATEAAWLKVVIRHEAMAIRRSRADCVADGELDLDVVVPAPQRSVEDQVLSGDRVGRSAEALRALKPDEARALMLKAHGMSYEEIGRHCGWTYTKVNRAITEGRRRFMEVYAALEEGAECERFAPVLRALAAGRATSEQLVEIRPHLRRCMACRATVRDLHLGRLPVLLPLPALAAALEWLRELFGRGATYYGDPIPGRLHRLKQHAVSVLHRTNSSDLAAEIHMAATSGGGRIATAGTIVGLCLSGMGAGTVCLVTGVLDLPFGQGDTRHHPIAVRHAHRTPAPTRVVSRPPPPTLTAARAVATPTATPRPPARRPAHRATPTPTAAPASVDPSQGTAPTSQEHAPISPAPTQPATHEFAAQAASGSGTQAAPAPAPATGGGEFGP